MREVLLLIDRQRRVVWSDSGGPSSLPDSRTRWEAIWEHRDELAEIVHTHPRGMLRFSAEDESTMEALGHALAETPVFSIVTDTGMLRRIDGADVLVQDEPWWTGLLRLASGLTPRTPR